MKKTFKLSHDKIKTPRLVEAIKHEVSKYIKRERRRGLPEGFDFLDFCCRFGRDEASSEVIHVTDINKSISWAESEQLESFYLEILATPRQREITSGREITPDQDTTPEQDTTPDTE